MRRRRQSTTRRPETIAVDRRLLADVEHLAETVAGAIGRLHASGRGFYDERHFSGVAKPLEDALARLGRRR